MSSSSTFQATNPETGQKVPPGFQETTAGEVDAACGLAAEAFSALRKSAPPQRASLLRGIAQEIMSLGDALVTRAMARGKSERTRLSQMHLAHMG